jgi:prevent-host-death family protein
MTELDEATARDEFTYLLDRVVDGKEHVVLTRQGRPVAVLVPAEDWRELEPTGESRPDPAALQRLDDLIAKARASNPSRDKQADAIHALKRDPAWQRRWDDLLARIQSHIPPEVTEEEIEADARAAREEVRRERRARGC